MGWGWLGKLVGTVFGSGQVTGKVIDMADKAIYTDQEKAIASAEATQVDQKDLADARNMQMAGHNSWFDVLVDGINRVIRPGVTIWIIGGFIGWWPLPKTDQITEYWQNVFWLILTFWFGGRALLKDLPAAIKVMRGF